MAMLVTRADRCMASKRAPSRAKARIVCSVRSRERAQASQPTWTETAASALLTAGLTLAISLGPYVPAACAAAQPAAPPAVETPVTPEEAVELERGRTAYSLQLQDNVLKAQLAAKRQQLNSQLDQVQVAIERKLIEERANKVAAEAIGDVDLASRIAADEKAISDQGKQVAVAAAKIEAKLDRAEMLARAKQISNQKALERAADITGDLMGASTALMVGH